MFSPQQTRSKDPSPEEIGRSQRQPLIAIVAITTTGYLGGVHAS